MALREKARIIHVALLVLAAWPIAHVGLAWQFDISPWKLAGWGMYSTPRFGMIGMEVYGHNVASGQWEKLTAPPAELSEIAGAFLERHRWLRGLAGLQGLAGAVGRVHPEWDTTRIVVAYPRIDLDTGMVVFAQDERRYMLR